MYNLIECRDNYSKTSGSLWKYCRDKPALTDAEVIANFSDAVNNPQFKFKKTFKTAADDTKNIYLNKGAIKIFK